MSKDEMSEVAGEEPPKAIVKRERRDADDVGGVLLDFLTERMAEQGTRRVMRVELRCVSDGFKSEPLEDWSRETEPETFGKLAHVEAMVAQIVELCESHTDASGEPSTFEIKTRGYDQSVKYRKVRVLPTRRTNDDRSMLLPHETPTGTGMLAMTMRFMTQMMAGVEQNNRNTAALQQGAMGSVLQVLKETREENASLRAERNANLRELEAARSEENERDMRFQAQEEADKRKMIMTKKFTMVMPVLVQAIAGRLTKGKAKPGDATSATASDADASQSTATNGAAPSLTKPVAKSPLELALVDFFATLADEQIAAIKGMLDVEQQLLLGSAIDAAETGGSPLLATMVDDFVKSISPERLITLLDYLQPAQRGKLLAISQLAKATSPQGDE